ncbi:AMP-dependent synthetase/ligase [Mycolicibacterium setense]
MTDPSDGETLAELFTKVSNAITLSWFTDDLNPMPDWEAPAPDSSGWCVLDSRTVREHVLTLAAGLIGSGVAQGDRVALMLSNRPEHWLADLAVLHAGGVPSTFYPTLTPEQVRSQAAHARISTAVIEGPAQLEQWSRALTLPELRRVIVLDPSSQLETSDVAQQSYSKTLRRGAELLSEVPNVVTERVGRIRPDHAATIIFTSGTTGEPKAVPLTHRNLIAVVSGTEDAASISQPYRTISHLPTAHIVDRIASIYLLLLLGGQVAFSPMPDGLNRVVARLRPTTFVGVPRIWEKQLARLERLDREHPDEDGLTLAGLDHLRLAVTAGAPISADVVDRLHGLGLKLVDMWGLTEAAGVICTSKAEDVRAGSVGKSLPSTEIRVAADGELLVRGPQISPGYLRPDGAVMPITDAEGWFATGDIGDIDADGYLRIRDRKKNIIITSGGKNISPSAIESLLTSSPLIAQALAFGDRRPYVVALLTVEAEYARRWLREQHGIDSTTMTDRALISHPHIRAQLAHDVAQANSALARVEQVKRWELLSQPWSVQQGTLTPSLKLRRPAIHERHRAELDALYREGTDTINQSTKERQ